MGASNALKDSGQGNRPEPAAAVSTGAAGPRARRPVAKLSKPLERVTKVTELQESLFTDTKAQKVESNTKQVTSVTSVTSAGQAVSTTTCSKEPSPLPSHDQPSAYPAVAASPRLASRLVTDSPATRPEFPADLDPQALAEWLKPRAGESYEEWEARFDRADNLTRQQPRPIVTQARENTPQRKEG